MDFYNPKDIEEKYYQICENRGYFEVDGNKNIQNGKKFCIMMPPPNVTGVLHIGHSLTFTLQDIMTRYKRMDGFKTLYQPGMDHAGIATQNVVEKKLLAKGITKESLGREKFVDEAFEQKAWDNIALPIGQGQTISQPYMVARMTELLELTPQSRVLEIGTGSGYQTAILAHLVQHVCSVERIKGLQWQARRRLKNLDLHNVSTRHGDGWQGWQARAPFDAIIVTAAPPEIPTALMTQLDEGGILVLPVGEEHQYLKRVRRRGGEFIIDTVEAVRFVPLVKGELA